MYWAGIVFVVLIVWSVFVGLWLQAADNKRIEEQEKRR